MHPFSSASTGTTLIYSGVGLGFFFLLLKNIYYFYRQLQVRFFLLNVWGEK